MAKGKKTSAAARDGSWRLIMHIMIGVTFVSTVVACFRIAELYVGQRLAYSTRPPRAVLVNRPAWMSEFLADEIARCAQPIGLHSAFDHDLLVQTTSLLEANPWVRRVKEVRRVYGQQPGDTIEIDCDYRAPAALVQWGDKYALVDNQGIQLPEAYGASDLSKIMFAPDGSLAVRIIQGVGHAPTEAGRTWPGEDLAAGLEIAKLLSGQVYAEQIRRIDVTNYDGRQDAQAAQIVLLTQYNTQIRWGRGPGAKDAFIEVPASVKLNALAAIYRERKRVDAGEPWIDIRFDRVTCPGPTAQAASTAPPSAANAD